MKVYLAGAWARKSELRGVAKQLNALPDIDVPARWLFEPSPKECTIAFLQQRAIMDIEDVAAADVLVRFTDDLSQSFVQSRLATGARMFEMGFAYAMGKTIIAVGGIQPIFDYLPHIIHVKDVEELKTVLLQRVANYFIEVSRGGSSEV